MTLKETILALVIVVPGLVVLAVGLSALFALPVMLLWNGLVPTIFGLTKISFLQAWGLNFLSSFLFKSHNVSAK